MDVLSQVLSTERLISLLFLLLLLLLLLLLVLVLLFIFFVVRFQLFLAGDDIDADVGVGVGYVVEWRRLGTGYGQTGSQRFEGFAQTAANLVEFLHDQ